MAGKKSAVTFISVSPRIGFSPNLQNPVCQFSCFTVSFFQEEEEEEEEEEEWRESVTHC